MTIETQVEQLIDWTTKANESEVKPDTARPWCQFGLTTAITQENLRNLFDRKELNASYVLQYNEEDFTKREPYSHIQAEIDAVYSTHKCVVSRYKTRLQFYGDDCAQKHYRIPSALNVTLGKFQEERKRATSV